MLTMKNIQILIDTDLELKLNEAAEHKKHASMSFLNSGKWQILSVSITKVTESLVILHIEQDQMQTEKKLKINQPVGIVYQSGFDKFIFDSTVRGYETTILNGQQGKILIDLPEKVEQMPRRSYMRQSPPGNESIKVLFWHRGYLDNTQCAPMENYWQGKLDNLSPGGMQLSVVSELADNYKIGQIVGLQFTPKAYQKPVVLEAHIRHFKPQDDGNVHLGVEFLGLESTAEGRDLRHRLMEIVDEYEKINQSREYDSLDNDE